MSALKKPFCSLALAAAVVVAQEPAAKVFPPTPEQKTEIHAKLAELSARIAALGANKTDPQLLADLQIHKKAADYILRFPEEFFGPDYAAETIKALDLGIARANELEAGTASWTKKTGNVVRGFVSRIDGSVQPYGLTIPGLLRWHQADAARRLAARHAQQLNEVRFINQQEAPHSTSQIAAEDYIQLEPFGRMNHSYRYYGETDVFDAIASVQQRYNIDAKRILIRGHSMGGQGAWHLGLQHPGFFAALEAERGIRRHQRYASQRLAEARSAAVPGSRAALLRRGGLRAERVQYPDSRLRRRNRRQLRASVQAARGARRRKDSASPQETPYRWTTKDLRALFLMGPKTGHSWHAESKAESEAFFRKALAETAGKAPNHVRFVTYTTRWNNAHWVTVEGLEETYKRADVDVKRTDDLKHYTVTTKNVSRVKFDVPAASFTIDGQTIKAGANPTFEKANGEMGAGGRQAGRSAARSTACRDQSKTRSGTAFSPCAEPDSHGMQPCTITRTSASMFSGRSSPSGCAATSA